MNRPLFRETIPYRPMMDARELPSRRRSIWTMTTSLMAAAGGILNEPPVAPRPRPTHPAVREIHKNAWLKRQTSVEKKGTPFTKKAEKFWVVFCVHDDSEALLEFYTEPKMATIHKPQSAISINSCLHVSPSIVAGQDNEYQFAVTLQSEVIRLVAANWEQMIEWVESLQGKLREMNILSPKDNLYSKLPETKVGGVASTRDPNSPLPPPPTNLPANQARTSNQNSSRSAEHSNRRNVDPSIITPAALTRNPGGNVHRSEDSQSSSPISSANVSSRLSVNGNSSSSSSSTSNHDREHARANNSQIELRSDSHHRARSNNSQIILHSSALVGDSNFQDSNNGANGSQHAAKRKQQISLKVSVDINPGRRSGHHQQRQQQNGSTSSSAASTTVVVIGNGDIRIHTTEHSNRPEVRNGEHTTSVIVQSNSAVTTVPEGTLIQLDQPSPQDNHSNGSGGGNHSTSCVSRVSVNCTKVPKSKPRPHQQSTNVAAISNNGEGETLVSIDSAGGGSGNETGASSAKSRKPGKSCSSENIYEHIYIPDRPAAVDRASNGVKCNNGNNHHKKVRSQNNESSDAANRSHPQRSPEEESPSSARELHARRLINGGSSSQRSSSLGRIEVPSVSNRSTEPTPAEARRNNGNRNHSTPGEMPRSVGNSTFFANNGSSHNTPTQLHGSPLDALIGSRSGEYRLRRDEYLIRMGESNGSNDNQSNNHISSQSSNDINSQSFVQVLPLKEQQVRHLQMEIDHPGGVRIILRKKDCLSSIAFVDYLGAVWIAGWKQQQYPVLYYGLHVGDQIMKVAGVNVQTSVEASRAIKMVSSMQVEFIIRRLPYGKVFALKRSRDGEPLGLIAEGGSGEISEVLPEGLAARYGLPPKGLSLDGRSPCNWYLTEVNNRPLSLMSKENEVKDRLNAVGKEISILVQPADLVKHLRKSLKSYKGFKDYVVG